VGDALLHALNELLCGGSNYRNYSRRPAAYNNRTVVFAALPDETFWIVIHCSYNFFRLEDFGIYPTLLDGQLYKWSTSAGIIKDSVPDILRTALTDPTGNGHFMAVDHIKTVVKQLQGLDILQLSRIQAGALTNAAVAAMKHTSKVAAGPNRKVYDHKHERLGSIYIETNLNTGEKFQVLRSSGKHTNAALSFLQWMKENVAEFVQRMNFRLSQDEKLSFLLALE